MKEKVILLVEDNPDDEELTIMAFQKSNIMNRMAVVRDGVEALDYLFKQGKYADLQAADTPELVLLDLKLPKLGGLEVLEKMRSDPATRLIPVVVLTSSSEEEDIIRSYSLGANSYVRKPVQFESFLSAVQNLGMYWLLVNQSLSDIA